MKELQNARLENVGSAPEQKQLIIGDWDQAFNRTFNAALEQKLAQTTEASGTGLPDVSFKTEPPTTKELLSELRKRFDENQREGEPGPNNEGYYASRVQEYTQEDLRGIRDLADAVVSGDDKQIQAEVENYKDDPEKLDQLLLGLQLELRRRGVKNITVGDTSTYKNDEIYKCTLNITTTDDSGTTLKHYRTSES